MDRTGKGWGSGLLGVVIFSGSLPATRIAVGGFTPLFLTSARAVIAACSGPRCFSPSASRGLAGATSPRWPSWRSAVSSASRC